MRLLRSLHVSDVSGYLKASAKVLCHDIMCKLIQALPLRFYFLSGQRESLEQGYQKYTPIEVVNTNHVASNRDSVTFMESWVSLIAGLEYRME